MEEAALEAASEEVVGQGLASRLGRSLAAPEAAAEVAAVAVALVVAEEVVAEVVAEVVVAAALVEESPSVVAVGPTPAQPEGLLLLQLPCCSGNCSCMADLVGNRLLLGISEPASSHRVPSLRGCGGRHCAYPGSPQMKPPLERRTADKARVPRSLLR